MEKYLITGSHGFLGRNICNRLSSKGRVFGLSRHGFSADFMYKGICADITNPLAASTDLLESKVVHCAALMRSQNCDELFSANVLGTKNVLDWCVDHQVKQMIHISTGGVYGYRRGIFSRETDALDPIGDYGISKSLSENLCHAYAAVHKINVVILRLYFPYGEGQQSGIFKTIESSLKEGRPLSIKNNGAPYITPTHIDDVVAAIEMIMSHSGMNGVFNLCGNKAYSFRDIVNKFENLLNIKAELNLVDEEQGDLMGCNDLLKKKIGWSPERDFGDWEIN